MGGSDLVSYERAISDNSSFGLGLGYGGFKIAGTKYSNMGGSLFYRYYFSEAIKGWYGMGGVAYKKEK